jgi:hypothetical protein
MGMRVSRHLFTVGAVSVALMVGSTPASSAVQGSQQTSGAGQLRERACRPGEKATIPSRRNPTSLVCADLGDASGVPQRAAGVPRGLIVAGAVASGLMVAQIASEGSNARIRVSVSE